VRAKHAAPHRPHGAANRVRIIGGQYRRRLLDFPESAGLRPTPDRVRETLFNWLGQDLPGWTCLDLFAGSGALGFEAASRGAARVVMIERDRAALEALEANRRLLGAGGVDILRGDALAWLAGNRETFDLVFVDPPFDSGLAGPVLADLPRHLKPGALVYVEQGGEVAPPPGFIIHRSGRAGRSHFALLIKDERC
jgi:16S rRNA (guanine966-N2)-methyltransferase